MALIGFDAVTAGGAVGAAIGSGLSGVGPAPSTTKMQVDLDEAPNLIKGLQDAIEKLQEAYNEANQVNTLGAPGKDPYSGNVATVMSAAAGGQPGGYSWANEAARKALRKTIENIEKSMADYRATDSNAQASMTTKE